ncbi:hypothetical protein Pmani_019416 [Petrolisthes manimaculis]|uniref:Tetraspanin-31 n=1 Tax=Petrolisthes manimaculis TaxID=1843537 RepID=A0AAE1PJM4_9EUCA|nr:hypothetical protein Pmani_019416 [Petrolisthes manimaculis]
MCGGFTCSKNSLLALNILYVVVSFIMIGVAAAAKVASFITSLSLVSGIIACGVFLLLISIVGLIGASKHHQVMLFFYMIVLFIIFIIQFSVACACLAINEKQQDVVARQGWISSGEQIQHDAQTFFGCCGYDYHYNDTSNTPIYLPHATCKDITNKQTKQPCCDKEVSEENCCPFNATEYVCNCETCSQPIHNAMQRGFNLVGGIGLFFSFTEFLGVWLTVRFRNQRDPRANPSAFL